MIEFLFIEENPDDAELTLRIFKQHNILNKIHHAHNGEEALQFLNVTTCPTLKLILIDGSITENGVLPLLRKLKTDEEREHIQVVATISSDDEINILRSYNLGIDAYVVKPLEFKKLTKIMVQLGFFWLLLGNNRIDY